MSFLNESKTRLLCATLVLAASSTYLLASAAPPQVTALPTSAPVPSGTILPFGGTVAPAGYLLCDGTEVQRDDFPKLFATVGEAFGAATNFTFTLPDLRGRFLRGVDGVATNDPNHSTRTAIAPGGNVGNNVGSLQADGRRGFSGAFSGTTNSVPDHDHGISTYQDDWDEDDGSSANAPGWADDARSSLVNPVVHRHTEPDGGHSHPFSVNVTFNGESETRPKNVYVNYIIKL